MNRSYHHGDLVRATREFVARIIAEEGLGGVAVRRIAAQLEVSHTAIFHHFGSRAGLLTAVAAEGFDALAVELAAADASFLDMGAAYVRFAGAKPGHFTAMFATDALIDDDETLVAARARAMTQLRRGVDTVPDADSREGMAAATLAGWAMMHGLVHLLATDALQSSGLVEALGESDADALARRIGIMLYGSPSGE